MRVKGKLSNIFWKGLLTLLPLYLTVFFLLWLAKDIELTFGEIFKPLLGKHYIPGMGLAAAILLCFGLGLLMQAYITRYLNDVLNRMISRLPVIGDIYASLQSVIKYLTNESSKPVGEYVVMVHFDNLDMELIGIVTRKDFKNCPEGIGKESWVSVYLPMSYQIGGFTVYVPENKVRKVDLTAKQALKWALIGGIEN